MPSSATHARPIITVILAAGMGTRLQSVHAGLPKGLVRVGATTLIERSLDLLLERGITTIILVTGFAADAYTHLLGPRYPAICFVHNADFARNGSMHSLYLARHGVDGPFLLLESDLLFEARALDLLLASESGDCVLLSGPTGHGDEVRAYASAAGTLERLTKEPQPGRPSAGEFTGLSRFTPSALDLLCRSYEAHPLFGDNRHYDDCLSDLGAQRPVGLLLAADLLWTEIDDPDHYEIAKHRILPALSAS